MSHLSEIVRATYGKRMERTSRRRPLGKVAQRADSDAADRRRDRAHPAGTEPATARSVRPDTDEATPSPRIRKVNYIKFACWLPDDCTDVEW
jgi:hypothetical protein